MRYLQLFIVAFFLSMPAIEAQETAIYTNEWSLFLTAKENYERGNFALAANQYRDYLSRTHDIAPESKDYRIEASYFAALCAKKLKRADAEQELNRFIADYGYHRKFGSLTNFHLAQLYFDGKRYKEAESSYQQVFVSDLNRSEKERYYFQTAYSSFFLKDFETAQRNFEQAANLKGDNYYDANYYLGFLAYEASDYTNAVGYFKEIEEDKKYKNIVPYYIAQILFQQNKLAELRPYLEKKIEARGIKYKKELRHMLGLLYYQEQNFEAALPHIEYYVKNSAKVEQEDIYMLAFTQYRFGKYEDATKNFSELTTLENEMGQNALYHLADCYLQTQQPELAKTAFESAARLPFQPQIVETSTFNAAKLAFQLENYNDAVSEIKKFIETYPTSKYKQEANTLLSRSFEKTNNYKEAVATIEQIKNPSRQLQKTYQRMAYGAAIELLADGQEAQAIQNFEKCFTYKIDNRVEALARFWLGNIYFSKNKYDKSERYLQEYLRMANGVSEGKVSPATANYTLGYIYFNQKEYNKANPYFEKTIKGINPTDAKNNAELQKIYPDAVLRSADCSFQNRDYAQAGKMYQKIIDRNAYGADYATFQKGMIAGLEQNYAEKVQILNQLMNKYKDSFYADDALYEAGSTQSFQEDFAGAISTFDRLIRNYPKSKFKNKAQLDIGLAHYRLQDSDAAIASFQKIIEQAPKSPEASAALSNIQNIYIERGNSAAYFDYIKDFPDLQISSGGQDSLTYKFAETLYENGDCVNSVLEFDKYLIRFPKGAYASFAHYFRGDCLFRAENYERALPDFEYILNNDIQIYKEQSLDKAAYIVYQKSKDFPKAFDYYSELYSLASRPQVADRSLQALVFLTYTLGKNGDLNRYAAELLTSQNFSAEEKNNTEFYLGKTALNKNQLSTAKTKFEKVARFTNSAMGAEARYHLAKMLFDQNRISEAKKAAFRVDNECPLQTYWRVKAFILLADIYSREDNLFQARNTLQSILDNFSDDPELRTEAEQKLAKYTQQQQTKSKLKIEQASPDTLELDNSQN